MKKSILFLSLLGAMFACTKETSVSPDTTTTALSVVKGSETVVTLPITYSPGSTGIFWYVVSNANEKIAKIDSGQIAQNIQPAAIWGTHIWKITGVVKGTSKIKLALGRPIAGSEVYGQHTLDVTVTE